MINEKRVIDEFIEMVKIYSPSLNERDMADYTITKLKDLGLDVIEDDVNKKINGNTGNVIGYLKGDSSKPKLMFSAHLDTVEPAKNIKPIIEDGYIKTDGTTILGGDDKAGLAAILEMLRIIKENNISHPDIYIIFSVAEEIGLLGARNIDLIKYNIDYGFILDADGEPGTVIKQAPYQNSFELIFKGKAAHAGMEPEKGINALMVAANAINKIKFGRINSDTTINLGIINGGRATNIVMEEVKIEGEARSYNEFEVEKICEDLFKECEKTANEFGAKFTYSKKREYNGFLIDENSEILNLVKKACEKTDLKYRSVSIGGGSDVNVYNEKNINAINLSIGMEKMHTVEEKISIKSIIDLTKLLVQIIKEC